MGNHIVTALSQEAVNNVMKEQLYIGTDKEDFITYVLSTTDENTGNKIYFQLGKNTDVSAIPEQFELSDDVDKKTLFEDLEALHLFDIPTSEKERTEEQKQALSLAYQKYYLDSAFRFTQGLPSIFKPEDLISFKPLELVSSTDPNNCGGIYTQCFREIVIIECSEVRRKFIANIKKQSDAEGPWMISYKVLFNYKSTEYNHLPDEVKKSIGEHFENIPTDQIGNLFEIQQLMVDMSNLSQSSMPEIEGVEKKTQLNVIAAFETFIKEYLAGKLTHGYALIPSENNTYEYIFKPTKYSFSVTSNQNDQNPYKTLNYIMSTTNDEIVPQQYDWDWINQTDKNLRSGVMAIHRDIFFEKFNSEFKKLVLPPLRKKFIAKMSGNHQSIFDMEYICQVIDDESEDKSTFTLADDGESFNYTEYSNSSNSGQISVYVPPCFGATGGLKFKYSVTCNSKWGELIENDVKFPAIIYTIEITLFTDIEYDSGHSRGNIYHKVIECGVGIGLDEYGRINIKKQIKEIDKGETLNINLWSEIASFGSIESMIKEAKSNAKGMLEKAVTMFTNNFSKNFLGYANWVMLGSKSFTFSDENFQKSGDFSTAVKYVNPANSYIMEKLRSRVVEGKQK